MDLGTLTQNHLIDTSGLAAALNFLKHRLRTLPTDLLNDISDFAYFGKGLFCSVLATLHSNVRRMNGRTDNKKWLTAVAKHLNLSPSQLALNAGMAASTLTRYLNDNSGQVGLTEKTLEKIASYSGFRPGQYPGGNRAGFSEADAVPYNATSAAELPSWVSLAIREAKGGRNDIEAWVMKGGALDAAGVLPGDILIFDQNARARSGDIVLAQIVDYANDAAETVIRLYQPPYLITHSMRLGPTRPEQVDEDRVSIVAVSCGIIRLSH